MSARPIRVADQLAQVDARPLDEPQHLGVLVGLQPVGAHHAQLVGDHPVPRDRRHSLRRRHQPDLDVRAALAQRGHRRRAGGRQADAVQRQVRAAAGQVDDRGRGVGHLGAVHGGHRAELGGEGECRRRDVDGDDQCAGGHRQPHRRRPGAAAAVHGDPAAGQSDAVPQHRPVGRREAAAERRCCRRRQPLGHPDQVDLGVVERHQLREGTPMGRAGLELRVADLLVPDGALRAAPAGAHERRGHPVAHLPAADVRGRAPRSGRRTRGPRRAAAPRPRRAPAGCASRCGRSRWPRRRSPPRRASASDPGTSRTWGNRWN